MLNNLTIQGRLVCDPEIKTTAGGTIIAAARIACARDFVQKDKERESDFFRITCFGKTAEFLQKYFRKGDYILISGTIQNDNYTNRDGQSVYATQIVVNHIYFSGKKENAPVASETKAEASQGEDNAEYAEIENADDDFPF